MMHHNSNHEENMDVRGTVREEYGKIARQGALCCGPDLNNGMTIAGSVAEIVGYSDDDLAALPDGANMGLSCGNPTAMASLKPGETVLDLGAGGGFDAFMAARKVGPTGRVIGVDMTPDMIDKVRQNAKVFLESSGLDNVEFRLGEIEHLPVADASVDVIISNCVINLSPDKNQVWKEIARVLMPGGRVSVSDLALLKPLPEAVKNSVQALVSCIAGAVPVAETREMIRSVGLVETDLKMKSDYINQMTKWAEPFYQEITNGLPANAGPGDYITSLDITAVKQEKS